MVHDNGRTHIINIVNKNKKGTRRARPDVHLVHQGVSNKTDFFILIYCILILKMIS